MREGCQIQSSKCCHHYSELLVFDNYTILTAITTTDL
jgi:hypothetical protein